MSKRARFSFDEKTFDEVLTPLPSLSFDKYYLIHSDHVHFFSSLYDDQKKKWPPMKCKYCNAEYKPPT